MLLSGVPGKGVDERLAVSASRALYAAARSSLATLRFHEPKTERPEKYAKLNLLDFDAPGSGSTRVTVQDSAGAMLAELLLGNSKFNLPGTKTGGIYLRLPGEQRAWLAAGGLNLSGLPGDWLEPTVLHVAGARIKRTEIRRPQGPPERRQGF